MLPYLEIYIYTYINTDETPRVVPKNAKFTAGIGVQDVKFHRALLHLVYTNSIP